MESCRVKGCRYPFSHVTCPHQCGTCGKFGHGQVECGNPDTIDHLYQISKGDKMMKQLVCTSKGCVNSHSHSIDAHICSTCGNRHPNEYCVKTEAEPYLSGSSIMYVRENYPRQFESDDMYFGEEDGKRYTTVYAGMGCVDYLRRDGIGKPIYIMFMHSDCWGQYGTDTNHKPALDRFLDGYQVIE